MPSSKGADRNIPRKAQKTFTRDETARSWPSQGVEAEGLGCRSEAKIPCAAAGTDERFLAAAAIQTNMRGYIGGRQPPYAAFWLLFVRTKSNPGYGAGGPENVGARGGSPHKSPAGRPERPAPQRGPTPFSLMWFFGYFLSVKKGTRGMGQGSQKMLGPGGGAPTKVRRAGPRDLPANVITPFSP